MPQFPVHFFKHDFVIVGPQKTLSNLDSWFHDYYKTHEYHSWDDNPLPLWLAERGKKQAEVFANGFVICGKSGKRERL